MGAGGRRTNAALPRPRPRPFSGPSLGPHPPPQDTLPAGATCFRSMTGVLGGSQDGRRVCPV